MTYSDRQGSNPPPVHGPALYTRCSTEYREYISHLRSRELECIALVTGGGGVPPARSNSPTPADTIWTVQTAPMEDGAPTGWSKSE